MSGRFPEPREWEECAYCRNGAWERYFGGEDPLEAFLPCPECGQPPRCHAGSKTDRWCERPGTVQAFGRSGFVICGQHFRNNELCCELEEWEQAREHVGAFSRQADLIGGVLSEAMDLTADLCDAKIASIEAELSEIPW